MLQSFSRNPAINQEFSSRLSYPDPLKPSGIEFTLPEPSSVTLTIFDTEGHEVAKLIDNVRMQAGTHSVDFVSRGYAQGTYYYRLHVEVAGKQLIDTKRIVVGQ